MLTGRDTPAALREQLTARLDPSARQWLDRALADAARADRPVHPDPTGAADRADPTHRADRTRRHGRGEAPDTRPPAWELRFASAGRHCRPSARTAGGPAGPTTSADLFDPADAARVLLLHAARADAADAARLYEHGTAAERRAVLLALPHLDVGDAAVPIVEDALRTNDTTLVAAAVGPYAAERLDPHAWRHAVLKCLFTGVPVDFVAGLDERARGDAELARMLGDHAAERTAAGRPVPDDLHRVLDLAASTPHPQEG